ncbi:MAG TPA: DUF4350 domain-containing protein, partial [Acidimicrobiia bacterium]|nr:DUF4350 domain-containing protein [Acidimicrobiia bacterium]
IVLEPQVMTTDDTAALLDFVTAGGRLVIGGQAPFYVKNLRDRAPAWDPAGRSAWLVDDPALPGVRSIETAAQGSWTSPGSGRVVVGDTSRALVTLDRVAAGSIVFLADPSPLENAYLDHADNAAFGLDLAGGRPVVFGEGVHGFGRTRGVAAIPGAWKVALVLIGIAALAFVWSRARRFGPPDREARELPPARAEYVEALSLSLERTRDRAGALAPAQRFALDRIAARDALGATPDAAELARAARRIGCSDEEVAALVAPVATDAEVLAVGRAVSRVSAPAGARGGRTG